MKKKIYLLCLLGMVSFGTQAQLFGGKKSKEEKLKKAEFPKSSTGDAETEKQMLEALRKHPEYIRNSKGITTIKILHMTNDEWWVSKDQYGQIIGLNMHAFVGYTREDGNCYMISVLFHKAHLGGGQYQQTLRTINENFPGTEVGIECAKLDAAVQADGGTK